MTEREQSNIFDDLNDALSAQMLKLQSIDPRDTEQMEACVKQSREVSRLAGNIIRNTSTAIDLMRAQHEIGLDLGNKSIVTPKTLQEHY